MAWRKITTLTAGADQKFATAELTALAAVSGAYSLLDNTLNNTVAGWLDAIEAAGYTVNTDSSVPDALRSDICADAVWTFLNDFPKFSWAKTRERGDAAKAAAATLKAIREKTYGAISSPFGDDKTTSNWNSAPKLIGRMNPVPQPRFQMQSAPTPLYANPNAPSDTVPTKVQGVPGRPLNLQALPQNNAVLLSWGTGQYAVTYNVYRGTSSTNESLLHTGATTNIYVDSTAANGTAYYYTVTSVNTLGESAESNEAAATPAAPPHA